MKSIQLLLMILLMGTSSVRAADAAEATVVTYDANGIMDQTETAFRKFGLPVLPNFKSNHQGLFDELVSTHSSVLPHYVARLDDEEAVRVLHNALDTQSSGHAGCIVLTKVLEFTIAHDLEKEEAARIRAARHQPKTSEQMRRSMNGTQAAPDFAAIMARRRAAAEGKVMVVNPIDSGNRTLTQRLPRRNQPVHAPAASGSATNTLPSVAEGASANFSPIAPVEELAKKASQAEAVLQPVTQGSSEEPNVTYKWVDGRLLKYYNEGVYYEPCMQDTPEEVAYDQATADSQSLAFAIMQGIQLGLINNWADVVKYYPQIDALLLLLCKKLENPLLDTCLLCEELRRSLFPGGEILARITADREIESDPTSPLVVAAPAELSCEDDVAEKMWKVVKETIETRSLTIPELRKLLGIAQIPENSQRAKEALFLYARCQEVRDQAVIASQGDGGAQVVYTQPVFEGKPSGKVRGERPVSPAHAQINHIQTAELASAASAAAAFSNSDDNDADGYESESELYETPGQDLSKQG